MVMHSARIESNNSTSREDSSTAWSRTWHGLTQDERVRLFVHTPSSLLAPRVDLENSTIPPALHFRLTAAASWSSIFACIKCI
jgi:hypothetical protein